MSYNQSRPDRSETQYRRTGRSTTTGGYHHQQQQQQQRSKGGAAAAASGVSPPVAAAPAPSSSFDSSSNRSFKKSGNAQGGQARVNLPPHSNHNGPHVQSRSQGVAGEPVNQAGAIPKAPASQSTVVSSKSNETANTAKVSGDPSKAFAFQFGSLGPDLMKIPARTSSAPPNMDEQKRAQMQASLRTAQNVPASAPKKDSPNKAADNHLMRKEGHNLSSEKADGQVPHIPPPSQMQKSPITTIRMPAVQTPFQHGQVPHPVHFGGPNMHMQPPTVTATSFQIPQMPMPMALSLGNTPQIQQQVFFQSLPSHPMHHQGMMHQAQGHGFATSMGPQIHPQLGHVGVGMSPQYPQQQGGKYSGARKTTPVKITHPDTHEELRLDRRGDPRPDGEPVASKPHSNTPPRSQPASAFGPRPVNLVQTSYNSSPMIYPPVSMPLNSGPMSSAQAPRYHFQGNDGPQRAQFINQSAHTAPQLVRPAAPAQVLSDSTSSTKARDAQNVISSVLPASTKVTVKPAAASEKHGSPKARSHEEVSISLPQKDVEAGSLSSQQPKPGFVSGQPKSSAPPAKSSLETSPVATTEMGRGEMVNESNSVEDQKRTEDRGQTMPEDPVVSDLSPPSSFSAPETDIVAAKANSSVPATNGFSKKLMEVSLTSDAPTSNSLGTNIDKTTEGSSHASSEKDLKCDEQTISDKHVERSVISEEKHETISGGKGQNEVDGVIDVCPVSENLADVTDDKSSELPHSTQIQSSTVPLGHSEILPKQLGVDNSGDSLISAPATLSKDKSASELNSRRNTSTKGKKKIKEILQKADAAGTTSDLYMAYKGPEEKKEITTPSESAHVIHDASNQKLASAVPQAVAEATVDAEPVKNEPEDWEDAADVSTPKLDTADFRAHAQRGSSDEARDSGSNTEKKYSRDFLLKFADLFTALPEGFDVSPDIANALICANMGTSHHENDLYPTTGKVMDRQGSGARLDRRPSNMVVDDRWTKNQGSMSAGYGGNTGFRPGPGVNSGVLRNPRNQGPLMSRPTQSVGPGMGRNNPELERWQRGSNFQQKGLFPSPHTPMQVMHKAERKYQVGTIADEEQAKQRQLKGILNKLTPQNFDKLFEQVKNVNIDNAVTLSGVISQIFDKALMEPTFCEMYANFCLHLSGALPDFNENGEKITFKRLLLNKCQEEFERGEKEEEEASRVAEEGQVQQTEEEREEKRLKVRRRMLGNIRLIGELYKKRMLTEKIMHACIQKLLGYDQDPHEENIEALCKLMSTIGVMIDHNRAKVHMDAYFEKMKMLSNKQELSSRVRFMLINAIDLRKNKWQERMKVEGPKKIEEVHRDAAQERQTQANRLSRGPSMNSSARRGHMEFSPRGGGGMLSPPSAQMGGFHGPPQNRGYGNQDIRFDERAAYEPRMVPMPQRSVGEEPIMLGPQGGLGQGMSIRRPAVASNTMQSDATQAGGDSRRPAGGLNGFGSQRPASPATHGRLGPQERGAAYVHRDFGSLSRPSDPSSEVSSARQVLHGPSSTVSSPRESALSEEKLRDMSLSAIKEYYSARDEKEIGMCMKDMNSSAFHPTMISLWVTDSFERKDKERDLLAKLLVSLVKSADNALTDVELVKGFESVLTTLEDAVNDAPRAAEFLGKIFGKSVTENVVSLTEIGRLVREGGEEPGSLIEFGLGGDVVGSVLEMIKTEAGEEALVEIRRSSGLRIEDFKPPAPTRSKILERFT